MEDSEGRCVLRGKMYIARVCGVWCVVVISRVILLPDSSGLVHIEKMTLSRLSTTNWNER